MQTSAIYIKTDPEIKIKAQKIAKELGFSLSSLMNAWLKQLVKTKKITFSATPEEPSEYLKKAMRQAEKNWKEGKTSPAFKTGEEAVVWLEKQGI